MKLEKYNQAWKDFQARMADLRKEQAGIFLSITKKLDQQKIANIIKKLKDK